VKPEHRGNGIGKAFFGELAKVAQEKVLRRFCSFYKYPKLKNNAKRTVREWTGRFSR
jgi:hypothetical protein